VRKERKIQENLFIQFSTYFGEMSNFTKDFKGLQESVFKSNSTKLT